MAAITNLEDLPELVMEKITSFLNHKQLLALEQVSRKLKCAVDDHFSLTDHLIIGSLAELVNYYDDEDSERMAKDKKYLDGFHKIITRCGIRLRTIQITLKDQHCSEFMSLWHCSLYFKHTFASTGESCKLRGIALLIPSNYPGGRRAHSYERIVKLYSNLEQIAVVDYGGNFHKFLPQFVENGLKDLKILSSTEFRDAKKYCEIGKNLRTLHLNLRITSDDVAALNQLHLLKNVTLKIDHDDDDDDFLPQLNDNICNSVIEYCNASSDYSSVTKLKNVHEFGITKSEQVKVIAEQSFPELKRIRSHGCLSGSECSTYFTDLLTNKGNQLTSVDISFISGIPIDVVWQALKHCRAARSVHFSYVNVDSQLSVTAEDMKAICHLPNLQHFVFVIVLRMEEETCRRLRDLMETTVKEHLDFQFKYECETRDDDFCWLDQTYSLCRIHF